MNALNRYKCPANCLNKKGKVWGTLYYDVVSLLLSSPTNNILCVTLQRHFSLKANGLVSQQSSICRAAMHYGVIDNNGGVVDITRKDRLPFFVKSTKNGIESFRYVLGQIMLEKMMVPLYTDWSHHQ